MRTHARLPVLTGAGLLVAGTVLTGCGGDADAQTASSAEDSAESGAGPDEETAACRTRWSELHDDAAEAREEATGEVDADSEAPPPSALASRWTSVEDTIEYYVSSATADDCGETLTDQDAAIESLGDFTEELSRFDVQLQLVELDVSDDRRQAQRAIRTLVEQAPRATEDQAAAWQQATVVDLDDAQARRQAVADLRLLSEESQAWQRSQQAVRLLERSRDD